MKPERTTLKMLKHAIDRLVHVAESFIFLFMLYLIMFCCSLCSCASIVSSITEPQLVLQSGRIMCTTPATVYVPSDTKEIPARHVQEALRYWNEATGLELFTWGGRLTTPYFSPAVSVKGEPLQTTLLVDYVPPEDLGSYDGYYNETDITLDCMTVARISVDIMYSYLTVYSQGLLRHEFGHALGLAHARDGGLMYERIEFWATRYEREVGEEPLKSFFIDSGWWVPEASQAEVDEVRSMYGGVR